MAKVSSYPRNARLIADRPGVPGGRSRCRGIVDCRSVLAFSHTGVVAVVAEGGQGSCDHGFLGGDVQRCEQV